MNCDRCGQPDVEVGVACPYCGAVVVAPEVLDSLLSMPAERVAEDLDDGATDHRMLTVDPGSVGPVTEGGDEAGGSPAWHEPEPVDPTGAGAAPVEQPVAPEAAPAPAPPASAPLPRRTPLAETTPEWGPRPHPPAVLAPPAPHPLDAPAVARTRRPSGTGLPSGLATGGPAPVPVAAPGPTPPPGPPPPSNPVPGRPTHPRVRRWFGRGTSSPEPTEEAPEPSEEVAGPVDEAFAGAPEGLLDGVVPEADQGPGVHDPAGLESAMGRLSAGARRGALAPLGVVAALLEPDEKAEAVVQGEYQHRPAVVVLTDRRVLVANDRRWSPDVRTLAFSADLVVHGWQDDRRATLVFVVGAEGIVVDAISDRPLARDLAQRVRTRCAGGPSGPPAEP